MSDLIPFASRRLGNETVNTVDGRDIYTFLGITKPYASWVKGQITRAHLMENRDFVVFSPEGKNPLGGRPTTEYHFTFDAAKHVGLISNSKKGHEVREYFIAKEKELAGITTTTHGDLLVQMAEAYRAQERRMLVIETAQHEQQQQFMAQQAALIESQAKAIEALTTANQAEAKADLALQEVKRQTVEEFILGNKLLAKFPLSEWGRIGAWLCNFCAMYNLEVLPVAVVGKVWSTEHSYPNAAFAAWLRYEQKRPRQIHLVSPQEGA